MKKNIFPHHYLQLIKENYINPILIFIVLIPDMVLIYTLPYKS